MGVLAEVATGYVSDWEYHERLSGPEPARKCLLDTLLRPAMPTGASLSCSAYRASPVYYHGCDVPGPESCALLSSAPSDPWHGPDIGFARALSQLLHLSVFRQRVGNAGELRQGGRSLSVKSCLPPTGGTIPEKPVTTAHTFRLQALSCTFAFPMR